MKQLQDLLYGVAIRQVTGPSNPAVEKICLDSRQVQPGSLFVAIKGTLSDGHQFISSVISEGAIVIVCEDLPDALDAKVCAMSAWSTDNTLMAKYLADMKRANWREVWAMLQLINLGAIETDVYELHVIPKARPSASLAVITKVPVGTTASTSR